MTRPPIRIAALSLACSLALLHIGCSNGPTNVSPAFGIDLGGSQDVGAIGDAGAQTDATGAHADTGTTAGADADGGGGALDSGAVDTGTGGAGDTGAPSADVPDAGSSDTAALDTTALDTAVVDSGVSDTGMTQPDTSDNKPDTNSTASIPWGSEPDAGPYDAGQYNYSDIQNTGGNTGSGGAGLCIPKISQLNLEKIKVGGKVDIIIFVDTSGSMGQEAKYVSNNLNAFGSYLAGKSLDYRVILIGKNTGCCKLTIKPPLGNNPKVFKHVNYPVYSTDGLKRLIDYYPKYQGFLRADATKNFLAITDDESFQLKAPQFEQKLLALKNPGFASGYVFHSIVAYGPMAYKGCSTGARIGYQYLQLTAKTGGVKAPVCSNNWSQIFNDIAKGVVKTAKPPCTHKIPLAAGVSSAKGMTVNYVAEDDFFNLPPAKNNACPANGTGYTVDNVNQPTKITLCNKSCDLLKGGGNIQFDFGCFL